MKILMLAENDPAGTAILFAHAVNSLTPHTCRLLTAQERYNHAFSKDLHLPWLNEEQLAEVEELFRTSDVFHFHMTADEDYAFGPFKAQDYMRGKMIVHHHHGHPDFRGNPGKYQQKYRERGRHKLLVSTPDLLRLLPEATWLPNLVPVNDPLYRPEPQAQNGVLRLGHSPTRKDLKNTDELLGVVERINGAAKAGVDLDLIDNAPHKDCLRRKQQCHAVFDHMQGYYGVSSLEALSQGKATIAGLDGWNLGHIKDRMGCDTVPWVIARSEAELEAAVVNLATVPGFCAAKGEESRRFMETYWTDSHIAAMLVDFYEGKLAPSRADSTVIPMAAPGTLEAEAGRLAETANPQAAMAS